MKAIYEGAVQPSPLVLFSSLPISSPFDHASLSIDSQLASDSFLALLNDSTHQIVRSSSKPRIYHHPSYTPSPQALEAPHPPNLLGAQDRLSPIRSIVLHLQSPNCTETFIRFPPFEADRDRASSLGIRLPYLHFQIKPLDHTFMLEVGVRDQAGERTTIRCSTFQTEARKYTRSTSNESTRTAPYLIHLPLVFPTRKAHSHTSWTDLLLPLPELMTTKYHSTEFVKVHANVRLRKIFFTADGKQPSIGPSQTQERFDDDSKMVVETPGGPSVSSEALFRPELVLFKGNQVNVGQQ